MDNKQNFIFKINTILLSVFSEDSDIKNRLISENEELSKKGIKKEYLSQYNDIKSDKKNLTEITSEASLSKASDYIFQNKPALAFGELIKILKDNPDNIEVIKNTCLCLLNLKAYNIIIEFFLKKLEPYKDNDTNVLNIMANALYHSQEHFEEAIPLLKELVKLYPDDSSMWFKLSIATERVYQDKHLDEQLKYAKTALKYSKTNTAILAFLARLSYRNGDINSCEKYFEEMWKHNPKPEDIVVYSRFLIKEGKISEGYKYHRARLDTGIVAYPKLLLPQKRWDGQKDLSNATVIVHYEQGFGDSVMFSRYIPELSKIAKKVIFVVQKNLVPLFKSSGFEKYCEILSHEADVNPNIELENTNRSVMYSNGAGMGKIPHDYHIPIMDLPFLMEESTDKMYLSEGYLKADEEKIKEFRKKYIKKTKNLKIGLAYHGTKESILTYRDISVKKFLPLLKMEGIDFYSFQADKYAKELQKLDKSINIIDIGQYFKDFEDTACAMSCMDLIISTDNVVMNLGGALGIKTYVLFNKYTESRWYITDGDNLGWYKSVKPFHAKTFNDWDNLIEDIKTSVEKSLLSK